MLETLYTQSCFVKAMFTNTPPQRGITHLVDVLQPTLDTYLKSFLFVLSLPSYIRKYEQYRQKEIKQLKLKNCSTDCGKTMFFSNQVYIWTCKCCCFFWLFVHECIWKVVFEWVTGFPHILTNTFLVVSMRIWFTIDLVTIYHSLNILYLKKKLY